MKIEEAIAILENSGWWGVFIPITTIEGRSDEDKLHQAIDMAISALRSVSREQVEMAWRGEWGIGGTEMTDREKMIDLIINAKKSDPETGSFTEYLADFLLGYGIKLPDPTPQPGKPLTLEQLREMDGKPVWVEFIGHPDGTPIEPLWMLVNCREKRLVTDIEYVDWNFEGWFAYPYPPAHIDRSEWTAEWVPMTDDDGCVWLECSACEYDLDSLEEPHPFCPSCGRAMMPEAWAELERRLMK